LSLMKIPTAGITKNLPKIPHDTVSSAPSQSIIQSGVKTASSLAVSGKSFLNKLATKTAQIVQKGTNIGIKLLKATPTIVTKGSQILESTGALVVKLAEMGIKVNDIAIKVNQLGIKPLSKTAGAGQVGETLEMILEVSGMVLKITVEGGKITQVAGGTANKLSQEIINTIRQILGDKKH